MHICPVEIVALVAAIPGAKAIWFVVKTYMTKW